MSHSCTITVDQQGTRDDVFDPDSGTTTPPAADASTLYTGPYLLTDASNLGDPREAQGGGTDYVNRYTLSIPLWAPLVPVGAVCTLTTSRDASLTGQRLRVVSVSGGTFAIRRRFGCELVKTGPTT